MRNSIIIKNILVGLIVALFIVSCKENEPKGDEFSWSPDGKKLAMINVESKELVLIELEGEKISHVTPIDSIAGEKEKIYMPCWSRDGRYLLYAKSSKAALDVLIYDFEDNKLTRIDHIPIDEKKGVEGKVFISWSPTMNRILWMSWNNLAEPLLFSALPDGKDKKLLIKLHGEKNYTFPAWSPDGEWIAYLVNIQDGNKNNGLWKIKYDGTENQQFFPANEITTFQWQPDGSHLSVVQKVVVQNDQQQDKSTDIKHQYNLSLIDSDGESEKLLSEEQLQILKLIWSPDGKQIAFLQVQDNSRDLWIINLMSNKKVKLNFNKVEDVFGWEDSNRLFFTIDYPKALVQQTKEQNDVRDFFETLRGIQRENLLIVTDRFQQKNLDKNIYAFTVGGQNSSSAYYKSFKPNISSTEIYFPIIEFNTNEKIYLAQTKDQYIAAADECYLSQKYQAAFDYLTHYWDIDLNGTDFQDWFNMEKIIEKLKIDPDSSQYKQTIKALDDGTILRTILTMRKLNQNEKANWLWNQLQKLTVHISADSKNKKDLADEVYWSFMNIYSSYDELASGIIDLDRFLQSDNLDSNLITLTNYSQAILAIQDKQYNLSLQKLGSAIKYLPQNKAELDDIKGLLSLCASNLKGKKEMLIVPILQQTIERFPDDKNVFQIYDMLGDIYLKQDQREKAMAAYQNAVVLNFDKQEIWDKIFKIK
jgi:Tol biopolymer transport system component